jgi:Ca-activated chloride channel family protein
VTDVTFLAAGRLWLFAALPVAAAVYAVLQRRRRHAAVRFPNLALLASVAPRRPGWRRHVSAVALVVAAAALLLGLARPARTEPVPREEVVVVLVVDVSGSMLATDVAPTRMAAAVAAARDFVAEVPDSFRVGLVSFDDRAHVLATPTADHSAVLGALGGLARGPGTAAGEGLHAAVDLVAGGGPATIELLADGADTVGRPLSGAAAAAAEAEIPVHTIAFGTDAGRAEVNGELVPVPADPDAMRAVADATGGSFSEAATGAELLQVYDDIRGRITYRIEERELAAPLLGAAAVALMAAVAAAIRWSPRVLA